MEELNLWLIATLSSVILGVAKWGIPILKDKVPNLFWPIALILLGKGGTAVCGSIGADCSGNPAGWGPVEATAIATALIAIVQRELISGLRNGIPAFDRLIQTAVSKLTTNQGGTVKSLFSAALMAGAIALAAPSAHAIDLGKDFKLNLVDVETKVLLTMESFRSTNNAAGGMSVVFPTKAYVLAWRDVRVLEMGTMQVNLTGEPGDPLINGTPEASGGPGFCAFKGVCLAFAWKVNSPSDSPDTQDAKGFDWRRSAFGIDIISTGHWIKDFVDARKGKRAPAPTALNDTYPARLVNDTVNGFAEMQSTNTLAVSR